MQIPTKYIDPLDENLIVKSVRIQDFEAAHQDIEHMSAENVKTFSEGLIGTFEEYTKFRKSHQKATSQELRRYTYTISKIVIKCPTAAVTPIKGTTAFHKAVEIGSGNTLKFLFTTLSQVNPTCKPANLSNNFGQTPLHLALNDEILVETLLKYNADPNKTDHNGKSVLHQAIEDFFVGKTNLSIIQMLLKNGAHPENRIKNTKNAIELAQGLKVKECINQNGAYYNQPEIKKLADNLLKMLKEHTPETNKRIRVNA